MFKRLKTSNGYRLVTLSSSNKNISYTVHRLVGFCFIPNPDDKPYINHKDGDKLNNNVDNLEWCTAKENDTHARLTGLKDQGHKIQVLNLLTEETTVYTSLGEAQVDLDINRALIHRCLKLTYGKDTYKHFRFSYI